MCVADGMGGHKDGEVASSIAITHISKRFKSISSVGNKEDAINWIQSTVSEANVEIFKYVSSHPESVGMGTTIVLAVLTPAFLLFGNIGDSSGYVIKNKKIHKITTDHTLVNLLVKSGELTLEEAKDHPRKNVLMKALGATSDVDMDVFDVTDDIEGILLCSDGLTNMLSDEQITSVLNEDHTGDEKLEKLIIKSNNRGGTDNISIAYLNKGGNDYDS
jgi:protein phosphatase